MEKTYRDIIMTISADAEQKDAKSGYKITARFIIDPAVLTEKDLVDLLFDSSSPRVKFANHHRPKGREHLAELAKQPYVEWILRPSGTRQVAVREMTAQEKIDSLLASGIITQEMYEEAMERANSK